MNERPDEWVEPEDEAPWPRDVKLDEAKAVLLAELFQQHPEEVFYGRQIALRFERRFYHWITTKALNELAGEGRIGSTTVPLITVRTGVVALDEERKGETIRFYWSRQARYWRRQAGEIHRLVEEFSTPEMMRAFGLHGEMMFDAALARSGWVQRGQDVRRYGGREWTSTNHNLDRAVERDGIIYGVEIKNSLSYIDRKELRIKLGICRELGLTPLFIVRMAPGNYIEEVRKAGGFTLVFEWQLYPHGHVGLARRVRERLGIKVDSPRAIEEGTMQRLIGWHEREVARRAGAV